ncbi:putative gamma interferon inducible lysosomal thiol reductase GILT, Thioredoxin-like superfamily [Helianthus annuus]|nr:putative gamma interferon inducible lysosomal thiol reductase GILT, Thioredoxin-like superfamily [Helianthus annuus]
MDSHRPNNRLSNVVLVLVIVSLPTLLLSVVTSEEKVKVTLYYESLCPSSEDFILKYLYKIFDNGLISIVDLKLSPYGNARITSDGTIVCQHGRWECLLNTVEACAIQAWPDVNDHFPFVYCVEQQNNQGKYTEWEKCFDILNLDPKPVADCYNSGLGHKLEVQYADETKALEPPHEYVPWVVVDGQPLYEASDYTNFISYICKAYKGSNVPQACVDLSHPITGPKDIVKGIKHVCYKEEDDVKPKSTLSEMISSMVASWMTKLA